jgi:hypothetical protein
MNRGDFNKTSQARGAFTGVAWESKSGIPDGVRPPYSWVLPITAGALAARNRIFGEGDCSISMAGGVNGAAALSGAGSLSGTGALIISMVAALTGSGTISSAAAVAYLNLAATLAGAGSIAASLKALGHAAAALSGSSTVSAATATALGELQASITVTGDLLTTANIGSAVWDYILSCGYSAEEAIQILTAVAAGKSTVTDLGGGNANVIFRDLQDTKDVVDADMVGSERDVVTLDP